MQIGPFRILDTIGSGGGGVVYRAHHTELDRIVAVKQIRLPPGVERERLTTRILREAKAMAAIESDHVVRLYSFQVLDERPTLEMEFVDGGSVETRLAEGPLTASELLDLLSQTLDGLAAVHGAGYLHRDVKPSNILRTASGRFKVADFGISGEIGASSTLHAGSVQYAAPEYVSDPSSVDARADLYSLGLVAYEAALGLEGFQQVFMQHAGVDPLIAGAQWLAWLMDPAKEPVPLHHVSPVPVELSLLVARLAAKDRDRRPSSALDALHELRALDLGTSVPDPRTSAPHTTPPRRNRWSSRRRLLAATATAAALLVILAGVATQRIRHAVRPAAVSEQPLPAKPDTPVAPPPATESTEPSLLEQLKAFANPLQPRVFERPQVPAGVAVPHRAEAGSNVGVSPAAHGSGPGVPTPAPPAPVTPTSVAATLPPTPPAVTAKAASGTTEKPAYGKNAQAPPPTSIARGVFVDGDAEPEILRAVISALRASGAPIAPVNDAARIHLTMHGGLERRPAPFATVAGHTVDYAAWAEWRDMRTGQVRDRQFSGRALEFSEIAARNAAVRALADEVSRVMADALR